MIGSYTERSTVPGLPSSTWNPVKLADFLVAEGVVDDISHEGLRVLARKEGVSFQHLKTWKISRDPDYAVKKACVNHLYTTANGKVIPEAGEPEVRLRGEHAAPCVPVVSVANPPPPARRAR